MSREEVKALLGPPTWGESADALGFAASPLEWGDAELRELVGASFLILTFDERGLARVQFPSYTLIGDEGTGRFHLERAREYVSAAHGPPTSGSPEASVLEWRTPAATITVRVDKEYDGPRERGAFGFHYHYGIDHYTSPREPDRFLRVIYERPA
jgi:hypothetical protein